MNTPAINLTASTPAAMGVTSEYLSFRLGAVEYGIDILKVQEIRGYEKPTRIANAPTYLKGVLNLRGVIVPIMDLRVKLDQAHISFDNLTVTVILNLAQGPVGAVVDAVSDVIELSPAQTRPAPTFDGSIDADYITGIGTLGEGAQERMLLLLDIERLLTIPGVATANALVH
nr:chemotaxis protein CheW [uncultured Albidiferax sp.]